MKSREIATPSSASMRTGLWILAFLLPAAWLAILSYLLKDRMQPGKLSLGDIVNIVALFLAAFSLFVAIAAYRDATWSSAEQQKALDASRGALEVVVERATRQQQLLERAAGTLGTQLSLLQEQTKRELERLGRRPTIEVALGEIPWSTLRTNPTVPVAFEQPWHTFDFLAKNIGTAPTIRPTTIISASPATVLVDEAGMRIAERPSHNTYQFSGLAVQDIQPFARVNTTFRYSVDVTPPQNVSEFDLRLRMFAENLPATGVSVHIRVTRPAPGAAPQ